MTMQRSDSTSCAVPAAPAPRALAAPRLKAQSLAIATLLCLGAAAAHAQSIPPAAASPNQWLQTGNANDAYWVEDNRWGQGSITEGTASTQFQQKVGVGSSVGSNGEVSFRTSWSWPNPPGANEVKGYPSILAGKKPGYASPGNYVNGNPIKLPDGSISQVSPAGATPGTILPLQLPLQSLKAKFATQWVTQPTGQGHLTFDIWLQSAPKQDSGFAASSITHEIMIPLQNWGNYGAYNVPGGRNPAWYDHDATIGGVLYHVYVTKGADGAFLYNFGSLDGSYGRTGWKMIAFLPAVLPVQPGEIDLAAIINYVTTRKDALGNPWATGKEYVSSVELGVEPVSGVGDLVVSNYKVWTGASTTTTAPAPAPAPAPTPAPAPAPTASTSPAPAPAPTCAPAPTWNSTTRYMAGARVLRNGVTYVATTKSSSVYNVNSPPEWTPSLWSVTTACTTAAAPAPAPTPAPAPAPTPAPAPAPATTTTTSPAPAPATCTAAAWNGTTRYMAGAVVVRYGVLYTATAASNSTWNVNSPPEWTPSLWTKGGAC
jgi:hypothetical protein